MLLPRRACALESLRIKHFWRCTFCATRDTRLRCRGVSSQIHRGLRSIDLLEFGHRHDGARMNHDTRIEDSESDLDLLDQEHGDLSAR